MTAPQIPLPHYPLLPFTRPRRTLPETFPPTSATPPSPREKRPPSLWRDSLRVGTGRLERVESWAFLVLAALVLPAMAINQSVLWHLLDQGALRRAIHAFLLAGSL